jgi:hypothetical protein
VSRTDPPKSDELEISIIGPGRGECVIVHLGDNEWCIVDSCTARGSEEPVALDYLRGFENGALSRVRLIVATHWHDDHIRGIASVLKEIPHASFSCSAALDTPNFLQLVGTTAVALQKRSGVDEFKLILDLLMERGSKAGVRRKLVAPMFAITNRRLLHLPGSERTCSAAVTALSPSDGTVKTAVADIAQLIPAPGDTPQRIVNRSPNRTSVVLWIEVGPRRALLGADLEHTGKAGEGWMAVLTSHQDAEPAGVFKIPHHGSSNADCPDVWGRMLSPNPTSVLTPFLGGKIRLPRSSDLVRLSARTSNLYCTAAGAGPPPPRDNAVERSLRQMTKDRRVLEGQPGHIRVRWSTSDEAAVPSVEMFHGAYRCGVT